MVYRQIQPFCSQVNLMYCIEVITVLQSHMYIRTYVLEHNGLRQGLSHHHHVRHAFLHEALVDGHEPCNEGLNVIDDFAAEL